MKLIVVECPCGQPELHRKFQDKRGYTSEGIFSLAQGRNFLTLLKEGGHMTDAECAEAEAELVASGLPEFVHVPRPVLEELAVQIVARFSSSECEEEITQKVRLAMISPTDADHLRKLVRKLFGSHARKIGGGNSKTLIN